MKGSASAQGLGTDASPLTSVLPCPAVLLAKGVRSPGSRLGALWPWQPPPQQSRWPPAMHKASRGTQGVQQLREGWRTAPCRGSQLTLQHDDGEVLCRLGLAGGEALVGPGVALLRGRDEEGLIADASDGDVVVHHHEVGVAVPADDVLRGPAEGTREDDGAADARFELLWCEGHTQRVCARKGESRRGVGGAGQRSGR